MVTTSKLKDIRALKDVQPGESIVFTENIIALGITQGTKGLVVSDLLGLKAVKLSGKEFTKEPIQVPLNIFVEVVQGTPATKKRFQLNVPAIKRPSREQIITAGKKTGGFLQETFQAGKATYEIGKDLYDQATGVKPQRRSRNKGTYTHRGVTTWVPRNKTERNMFLDEWDYISQNTYNKYYDDNNGIGKEMIEDLFKRSPRVYSRIIKNLGY